MSSMARKFEKNNQKYEIKKEYGVEPKAKCPHCNMYSVFKRNKLTGIYKCVRCKEHVVVKDGVLVR